MEVKKLTNCKNCGGTRIEESIAIGLSTETGNLGPKYKTKFFMVGTTQMYCDMCLDCGEILRWYIKEQTDRKWIKTPGSFGSK